MLPFQEVRSICKQLWVSEFLEVVTGTVILLPVCATQIPKPKTTLRNWREAFCLHSHSPPPKGLASLLRTSGAYSSRSLEHIGLEWSVYHVGLPHHNAGSLRSGNVKYRYPNTYMFICTSSLFGRWSQVTVGERSETAKGKKSIKLCYGARYQCRRWTT